MKIDVDLGEGTCWTIVVFILAVVLITALSFSYLGSKKDKEVQLEMARAGYSPIEISCAYNITAPLCMYAGSGASK